MKEFIEIIFFISGNIFRIAVYMAIYAASIGLMACMVLLPFFMECVPTGLRVGAIIVFAVPVILYGAMIAGRIMKSDLLEDIRF